ncbi:hypothetical protein BH23BAC3_BH23BAC3_04720 [soil metagenome]
MKHSRVVFLISILCAFLISSHNSAHSSNSDNQNESLADWEEPLEIVSGDAYRGPWEMNDSQWHFLDDPTVAINDNNVTIVSEMHFFTNFPVRTYYYNISKV